MIKYGINISLSGEVISSIFTDVWVVFLYVWIFGLIYIKIMVMNVQSLIKIYPSFLTAQVLRKGRSFEKKNLYPIIMLKLFKFVDNSMTHKFNPNKYSNNYIRS